MKNFIIFILIFTPLLLLGQSKKTLLVKKWEFKEFATEEKLDKKSRKMLEMAFKDFYLLFNKKGKYKSFLMGNTDKGRWHLKGNGDTIELSSINGEIRQIPILLLGKNSLKILIDNRGPIIMEVSSGSINDTINLPANKIKKVTASKKEIGKKWYLINKKSPGKEDKRKKVVLKLLEGSFIYFKQNGDYNLNIFDVEENGKWEFGKEKKSIITKKDSLKKVWYINYVDNDKLILIRGNTSEKWVFSTKKPDK